MGERLRRGDDMATTSTAVSTIPAETTEEPTERVAVITLRPTKPDRKKKVGWTEDTVDNENMNKKKSKCCCIYEKPRKFGESDSESSDDEECEHCFGHVEHKKHKHNHHTVETKAEGETSMTIRIQEKKEDSAPPDKEEPKKN